MACRLTVSTTGRENFSAKAGATVTVVLKAPAAVKAQILHIRYGGDEIDNEPPFEFTIKSGLKTLVVLAEASQPGALLQLVEQCDGDSQVIDSFHFDPNNPAAGYSIRAT